MASSRRHRRTSLLRSQIGRGTAIVLTLWLAACGSVQNVERADRFADAGQAFADSVPVLLDESFTLSVTANSLVLMQAGPALTREERMSRLATNDRQLRERLVVLRDIKQHALLLRSYFLALQSITQSDAPSGLTDAAKTLVERLQALHPGIANAKLFDQPVSAFIAPAVRIGVAAYQNAVLRRELAERAEAIEREIALQKAVLAVVAEQMRADKKLQVETEVRLPMLRAYVDTGAPPRSWIADRIAGFQQTTAIASVEAADKAAENLHQSWIAFAEGRLAEPSLSALIRDVEDLVALVGKLKLAKS